MAEGGGENGLIAGYVFGLSPNGHTAPVSLLLSPLFPFTGCSAVCFSDHLEFFSK